MNTAYDLVDPGPAVQQSRPGWLRPPRMRSLTGTVLDAVANGAGLANQVFRRTSDPLSAVVSWLDEARDDAQLGNADSLVATPRVWRCLVIHGHDHELRDDVACYLRHRGIVPVIMEREAAGGHRPLIDKFEECATHADFAIAIMTADDPMCAECDAGTCSLRPNVLIEYGYCRKQFGEGGVVVLYDPAALVPTDLLGLHYVDVMRPKPFARLGAELKRMGVLTLR